MAMCATCGSEIPAGQAQCPKCAGVSAPSGPGARASADAQKFAKDAEAAAKSAGRFAVSAAKAVGHEAAPTAKKAAAEVKSAAHSLVSETKSTFEKAKKKVEGHS